MSKWLIVWDGLRGDDRQVDNVLVDQSLDFRAERNVLWGVYVMESLHVEFVHVQGLC